MRKLLFVLIIIGMGGLAQAQKFYSNKAVLQFYSSTPVEDIQAKNQSASALVKMDDQSIVVVAENNKFNFPKSLMQEHFNENYMESDKYPKSTFTGKYDTKIDPKKNGKYNVTVSGSLIIHGVKKQVEVPATLEIKDGTIIGHSVFKVKTADYNITIPKIVVKNIAEEIQVTIDFTASKI